MGTLSLKGVSKKYGAVTAVNDITREVGGVVGIAVLSSVLISAYRSHIADRLGPLPGPTGDAIDAGAAAGLQALGARTDQASGDLVDAVREAFARVLQSSMWVAAAELLAAAAVVCSRSARWARSVRRNRNG